MSELSTKVRGIVDAARAAGGSTPSDRERVFASVAARVGIAVGGSGTAAGASATKGAAAAASATPGGMGAGFAGALGTKMIVVVLVASVSAAIGATAVTLSRPEPYRARASWVVAHTGATGRASPSAHGNMVVPAYAAPVMPEAPAARVPTASVLHPPSGYPARQAHRALPLPTAPVDISTLDEELRLLRGAHAALRTHDGAEALLLLAQHTARFPHGELREERLATQVFALCDLGRRDDAIAAARSLIETYPHSAHAARVRASCAGEQP